MYLNQRLVSPSTNNYGYKAYFDVLLNEEKNTYKLESQGYYKDTAGLMDVSDAFMGGNAGLTKRYVLVKQNRLVDFIGPLYGDLFQMEHWLLPGVEIRLRLWPAKSEFFLMKATSIEADFKFVMEDVIYHVCKVTVDDTVAQLQNEVLSTISAKYPYNRSRIHAYTINAGSLQFREDNLFQGEVPDKLVIAMVSSDAYQGSYYKNPFNLQHKSLTSIDVSIDDKNVLGKPLRNLNFPLGNVMEAYYHMFDQMDRKGLDIKRQDYYRGYTLFVFDTKGGVHGFSPKRKGNVKLEMTFATPLDETMTILTYGNFKDMFEVTKEREIKLY